MKIVVITGEESGDKLAAAAIREFKNISGNDLELYGIGGKALEKEGINKFFDISEINVMGLIEVIPKIFKIRNIIKSTVYKILELNPDLVFTVDSPDFTLRVANRIKSKNSEIKILHYVAPSVWAWRSGRIHTVKSSVDHLLTILPFEKKIFDQYKIPTTFVGHPITEVDLENYKNEETNEVNEKDIFLILPGSRRKEVELLLPIYLDAVTEMSLSRKFKLIMPLTTEMVSIADKILNKNYSNLEVSIINDEKLKYNYYAKAKLAIVTSGTAALELSYFKTPYVTAYKFNFLTYLILQFMMKIKMGNLVNIIQNKMIIPELIQNECKKENIIHYLNKYIQDPIYIDNVMSHSVDAVSKLKLEKNPSIMTAKEISNLIDGK